MINTVKNKFCLVTSLFNIKREEMNGNDGRSWDDYLKWFEKTLQIKSPMIIFVEDDMVEFVECRREYPTKIITHSVSEIPYYYLKDKIQDILNMDEYQKKINCPERIECQHSMYTVVQYSKFKWLYRAFEENPFNSKFFFWLDAGGSRFFGDYDISLEYPSVNGIQALEEMENKFLIQMNMECYNDLAYANKLSEEYLLDNRSYVLGSLLGGTGNAICKVLNDVEDVFINKMIKNKFVNNEQIALGYLVKQNPEDYKIYERYDGKHMSLFNELGKR